MQVNISVDLEHFVEAEFATGRYGSREEVLIQALRCLRDERQQAVAGIQQGLDEIAAGRVQSLADFFAAIRRGSSLKEKSVPE